MTHTRTTNPWISFSQNNSNSNSKLRLFCFSYAGGNASTFSSWSANITSEVEICPIELPGHGYRISEQPFDQLEPLIEELANALLPYLEKPFAFFGHSMGGLVSFELTHLLRKKFKLNPEHLYISGRRAPQLPPSKPPIHHLDKPEFINELNDLNGTPKAVLENAQLMELFLPVLRADFAAIENYVYAAKPLLDCPITVLGGLQDDEISNEDLDAWREQTNAHFSMHMFPGDHFFINSNRTTLLQFLNRELLKTLSRINFSKN